MDLLRSILARMIRAWISSFRWRQTTAESTNPVIYCVWHRDIAAAGAYLRNRSVTSLVSQSKDGDILVEILSGGKMHFARGSNSRHAVSGTLGLIRELRGGRSIATTWDGPKGPEGIPKPGPNWLSHHGKAPLVELRFNYGRHLCLKDWSRLRIPLPWTRIEVEEVWV